MRERFLFFTLVLLILEAGCLDFEERHVENLILLSWDGVQRDHLYELLEKGELSNLATLIEKGSIVEIEITDHLTDTKAGHTQMLTGYSPDETGVYSNRIFQPIPEGYTIFERLEKHLGKEKVKTIMLTGKTHNVGGEEGEPFYLTKNYIDVFDSNSANADVVGKKALSYLEEYKNERYFAFFHFSDPDHKGQRFGENSKEYEEGIKVCDLWLGKIISELKKQGRYDKTLILVTTDHGFDEGGRNHSDAPEIFLVSNIKISRSGDQKDIAPTILEYFGIDVDSLKPLLQGESLNKASKMRESEAFLGKEVFSEDQEGEKVHGYLSKPYGEGPFPAIVLVHGGFSSDKATKSMVLRAGIFFYERGYVTLAVDYSKSEFGGKEVDDVLSGIDYLKSLEYVSKIGLFGSSHGGYIVLMASTQRNVDAVVDCFGFTDLILMYEYVLSSEFHKDKENILLKMTEAYGGTPEEVPKVYREHSPLYHVEKINSPILLIHGMKDISVPWEQTKIFAETLEFHEKTYELFLFENASHGFIFKDTKEARDAWRKIFEFFERYLKKEGILEGKNSSMLSETPIFVEAG